MKWIKISLENAGIVTISLLPHGVVATMNWPRLVEPVAGDPCVTIEDALESLESALEDDEAEECG